MMIQSRMKFMLSDNCPTVVPNGIGDKSDPLRLLILQRKIEISNKGRIVSINNVSLFFLNN
jgi:hypothetical protein